MKEMWGSTGRWKKNGTKYFKSITLIFIYLLHIQAEASSFVSVMPMILETITDRQYSAAHWTKTLFY